MTSDQLVDHCLDVLGPVDVLDTTSEGLKSYAAKYGDLSWSDDESSDRFDKATVFDNPADRL